MPFVNIAGEKLHYHYHRGALQPKAPPLVLVHGAGGNLMHWPGELRRLPDHEVYALDLPGHGRSGGPGQAEIGAYTEVVREFADVLKLPAFVLGGHSMGGAIALEFALRYGGRLAGLILVGTGARLRVAPEILTGIRNDIEGTTALLAEWAHGEHVDPNLQRIYLRRLREVDPQVLAGDFLACDAFDRRADVAAIAVPALVVCGDADRMTPVKYSQFLAEHISGAQLMIVPGAGHMAMLEPHSRLVITNAVRQFLERLPLLPSAADRGAGSDTVIRRDFPSIKRIGDPC
jgi:pimeloyl-ACP methyl ester carboxylesterase